MSSCHWVFFSLSTPFFLVFFLPASSTTWFSRVYTNYLLTSHDSAYVHTYAHASTSSLCILEPFVICHPSVLYTWLGHLSLLAHLIMVAPYLNLLAHIPESDVTNCDSDIILQARIEDFGGVWWLVYSPQLLSSWNSCCTLTACLPVTTSSILISAGGGEVLFERYHLIWGNGKYAFLWTILVFTSNLCSISLQVYQRTIWGILWQTWAAAHHLSVGEPAVYFG